MESLDKTAPAVPEDNAPDPAEGQSPQTATTTKAAKVIKVEGKPNGRSKAKKKSTSHLAKSSKPGHKKFKKHLVARDTSSDSSDTDSDTSSSDTQSSESEPASRRKKKHSKKRAAAKESKNRKAGRRDSATSGVAQANTEYDSTSDDGGAATLRVLSKRVQFVQDEILRLRQDFDLRSSDYEQPPPGKIRVGGTAQSSFRDASATLARSRAARERRRSSGALGDGPSDIGADVDPSVDGTQTQLKKQAAGHKAPKRSDFRRVDQFWDNHIHDFKLQDTAEPKALIADDVPFQVRRVFDYNGRYKATLVDIKSEPLRECLQAIMGNVRGINLVEGIPKIDPNTLFLYLEELRTFRRGLKEQKPSGGSKRQRKKERVHLKSKQQHLKVLVRYLDTDYADVKKSLYPMLENGLITFDLLWALFKPDTLAYTTTYGSQDEPRAAKVVAAEKHHNPLKGQDYFLVEANYLEYDGRQFGYGRLMAQIDEFQGARKITSLSCYPLQHHKNETQLRHDLIRRGKKFVALSGVQYKAFQGMAYSKHKKGILKFNINGRIMVDPKNHRRVNANYPVPTVRPRDQDVVSDDDDDDADEDLGDDFDSEIEPEDGAENVKYVTKTFTDEKGKVKLLLVPESDSDDELNTDLARVSDNEDGSESKSGDSATPAPDSEKTPPEFMDEDYLIASSVVLGFALGEKMWLEFAVSGVKDIQWNENAYPSLVLEPKTKGIVKALVESHKYHAAESIDDVIQGKGKGLVAVLHGPPGTGKTLTAEGISELLKCPLYVASAGELSTSSKHLEAELERILDICHAWGAILLVDEADVYLEKRNVQDVHRNALVSVFLRQLEYFQGILFLTTNRVETFDDAFQSRIHIALRYDGLDLKAKKAIFKLFIERVRVLEKIDLMPFTEDDFDVLARTTGGASPVEVHESVESAIPAPAVTKVALRLRHLIEECVPCELEEEQITRPHSQIITKKVIQAAREAGGTEHRACVVYCLLVNKRWWKHQSEAELWDADLHKVRAVACEVIAKAIIEGEEDMSYLLHAVLLKRYSIMIGGRATPPSNVIEKAVDMHALRVIASSGYQKCIKYLWRGWLVQDENDPASFVDYKGKDDISYFAHLDPDRMRAPRYQNAAQMMFSLIYLGLYTVAINTVNPGGDIDVIEALLYIFTLGFIFDEATKFWKAGYHILGFWNAFNNLLYGLLTVSLVLRFMAFTHASHDPDGLRHHYNTMSYNFLAVSAPMFWIRLLLYLDSYRFFGAMLVVLKVMMKESIIFFALLFVIIIGFLQSFIGLDYADDQVAGDVAFIIKSMANAIMQAPDFSGFDKFQHPFGLILYYCFTFIVMVILLNVLIALYNSAYEDIYENANDEFLALFSQKTMQFVRAPDENVFIPPFNLIEVFLLAIPLEWWMSKKRYERVNDIVMGIIYSPLLIAAAYFETRTARDIRSNRSRGEEDDDTVEEWEQMASEVDFEADGWNKHVESAKPNVEEEAAVLEVRKLQGEVEKLKEMIEQLHKAVNLGQGNGSQS
ncbi:cation channel-like protein [Coniochaeta sp. 2T2.1]|nr:cation channel-like protein [Coniochaeta sp. 2T2.1]